MYANGLEAKDTHGSCMRIGSAILTIISDRRLSWQKIGDFQKPGYNL